MKFSQAGLLACPGDDERAVLEHQRNVLRALVGQQRLSLWDTARRRFWAKLQARKFPTPENLYRVDYCSRVLRLEWTCHRDAQRKLAAAEQRLRGVS
jgi:hypothetical protein